MRTPGRRAQLRTARFAIGRRDSCGRLRHAGRREDLIDAQATIATDDRCILYAWYDNEFGYSRQVVRILEEVAGLRLPTLPGGLTK